MSAPGKWVVYQLRDSRTQAVRYIGMTDNPVRRGAQHGIELLKPGPDSAGDARLRWFSELRAAKASFIMDALHWCGSKQAARVAEAKAIRKALAQGADLTNISVAASVKRKAAKPSPAQELKRLRARVVQFEKALRAIAQHHHMACAVDDGDQPCMCSCSTWAGTTAEEALTDTNPEVSP